MHKTEQILLEAERMLSRIQIEIESVEGKARLFLRRPVDQPVVKGARWGRSAWNKNFGEGGTGCPIAAGGPNQKSIGFIWLLDLGPLP